MFTANTELQVSKVDFNNIKDSIKDYISKKTEFLDYDFEGSTINYLVNILAYNTYMNSFYTNMAINESYLDTAQIRSNVVSNAKKLGYVPKSANASKATITLTFKPNNEPTQIKIPRGTKFTSTKDGVNYNFVTIQDYIVTPSDGIYVKTIEIYEGEQLHQSYNYSTLKSFYEILEKNVDLTSLIVTVKPNSTSTSTTIYDQVDDIINLDGRSEVYYIQENSDERYEVYFGDGILGKQLENGNFIEFDYITTRGDLANNLAVFKPVGYSGQDIADANTKYTATLFVEEKSTNGKGKENIESIRFNAPNFYGSQNRLVTALDFENYIYAKYPYIESVNVWGGEDHDPPVYGRVILSIKPFEGYSLQQLTKQSIINDMKKRNVLAIEPIIIDPIFTFIKPSITVTYDSTITTKTSEEIFNSVQVNVQKFEDSSLSVFGKSFLYSQFISIIDSSDKSILGNDTDVELEKRFYPIYNSTITYKLNFGAAIKHPYDGFLGGVYSTGFKTNTTQETMFLEDDGHGLIRCFFYQGNTGTKQIYKPNIGTVDYTTGIVTLKAMYITGLDVNQTELKIFAAPSERNYTQSKNQIILLSTPNLRIKDVKTQQIVKSGIIDVNGNYTPIPTNSVDTPFIL